MSLTLALGACAPSVPSGPVQDMASPSLAPLRVTNNGQPFRQYEGAAARRVAEAECAGQGLRLRPSIYDRFEAGAWVYVGGCA
ncbi:hypothetical protein [Pseudotabrizicola algicola]|uniref:Uncharacterized protein n=1 Tax=Pseudotabrizicola algicola TaxID=2709381 RepID=A0A6B3RHC8_9RHOB|nr:hypothetical protein [Pseudotabrizicola algicola]NEX44646.1 hypothetical protein [Pseudotabrizicola algicola]